MIPRLESMEDRMVPSAISFSPSVTAQIHKLGHKLQVPGPAFRITSLRSTSIDRGMRPTLSWTTHRVPTHQTNTGLFGIPWLKF